MALSDVATGGDRVNDEPNELDPFVKVMQAIESSPLDNEERFVANVLATWISYLEKTRDIDNAIGALRARLDVLLERGSGHGQD